MIHELKRAWGYFRLTFLNFYDFTPMSVLMLERRQLERLRRSVSRSRSHPDWQDNIRQVDLCLRLLRIVFEEDSALFWDRHAKMYHLRRYVNTRNAARYWPDWHHDGKSTLIDGLRQLKAWHIYNRLRTQYMPNWGD